MLTGSPSNPQPLEVTIGSPNDPFDYTFGGSPSVFTQLNVQIEFDTGSGFPPAFVDNPEDPDGGVLGTDPAGLPPDGYTRLNEVQLIGLNRWPALDPDFALLNRRSITKVLNGFFASMEGYLQEFPDREDFTAMQVEIDMDTNRIENMADATAPNDLVTMAQVEALA